MPKVDASSEETPPESETHGITPHTSEATALSKPSSNHGPSKSAPKPPEAFNIDNINQALEHIGIELNLIDKFHDQCQRQIDCVSVDVAMIKHLVQKIWNNISQTTPVTVNTRSPTLDSPTNTLTSSVEVKATQISEDEHVDLVKVALEAAKIPKQLPSKEEKDEGDENAKSGKIDKPSICEIGGQETRALKARKSILDSTISVFQFPGQPAAGSPISPGGTAVQITKDPGIITNPKTLDKMERAPREPISHLCILDNPSLMGKHFYWRLHIHIQSSDLSLTLKTVVSQGRAAHAVPP